MVSHYFKSAGSHPSHSGPISKRSSHPIIQIREIPSHRYVGLEGPIDVGVGLEVAHIGLHEDRTDGDSLEVAPTNLSVSEGAEAELRAPQFVHVERFRNHPFIGDFEIGKARMTTLAASVRMALYQGVPRVSNRA